MGSIMVASVSVSVAGDGVARNAGRYAAQGLEAEFEPGPRGRVPKYLLGMRRNHAAFDRGYHPIRMTFRRVIARTST